jgi:hypothetical protein
VLIPSFFFLLEAEELMLTERRQRLRTMTIARYGMVNNWLDSDEEIKKEITPYPQKVKPNVMKRRSSSDVSEGIKVAIYLDIS